MWNGCNNSYHTVIIRMFFPHVCRRGTIKNTLHSLLPCNGHYITVCVPANVFRFTWPQAGNNKSHSHDAGRIIKFNAGIHKMGLSGDNTAVLCQSLESRSKLNLLLTWNAANNKLWLREGGLNEKRT